MQLIKKLSLFFLLLPALLQAQIITTVVGTGAAGYSGDGGQATAAQLNYPYFIVIDKSNNLYISDEVNGCIRKVSRAGIITTIAGNVSLAGGYSGDGGPATAAAFNHPQAIALDETGNLYVVDQGNHSVRKITTTGNITTVAGTGTGGISGDGGQATVSKLFNPSGVCIDKSWNIYIGEQGRLRKVNTVGIISTIAGDGTLSYTGDGGPASAAQINSAEGNFIDSFGNIYFSDGNKVRMIDTAGIITTIMGTGFASFSGDGGPATNAAVYGANGVIKDKYDNIYVSDVFNNRVRKITTAGIVNTIAGNGTFGYNGDGINALTAQLCAPISGAFDSDGNFYIADNCNSRIRKIQYSLSVDAMSLDNSIIHIEPNPTSGKVKLLFSLNYPAEVSVSILDLVGKEVNRFKTIANNLVEQDLNLPDGLYFVSAVINGQRIFEKIVVQH